MLESRGETFLLCLPCYMLYILRVESKYNFFYKYSCDFDDLSLFFVVRKLNKNSATSITLKQNISKVFQKHFRDFSGF